MLGWRILGFISHKNSVNLLIYFLDIFIGEGSSGWVINMLVVFLGTANLGLDVSSET